MENEVGYRVRLWALYLTSLSHSRLDRAIFSSGQEALPEINAQEITFVSVLIRFFWPYVF